MSGQPSVILMGSKPGSVVALELLIQHNWDVRYVVVSRKMTHPWVQGPTLEEKAIEAGIKVVTQPQLPRDQSVDFVLSYMFRYRVKRDVLELADRAALNFHAGPLPEFGGWAFYSVAIMEQATQYGCTCHYMDEGFDTGPILKVRRFDVDTSQHTAVSLESLAQKEMVLLFSDFLSLVKNDHALPKTQQDTSKMRYMTREEFERLKCIPAGASCEVVERTARAFWYPPYQGAYIDFGGTRVNVVPRIASERLAALYHSNDLEELRRVVSL